MRKLTSSDLKDLNLFKHYRIIRKWVKRNYNIRESDFELLYIQILYNILTNKISKTDVIPTVGIIEDGVDCFKKTGQ